MKRKEPIRITPSFVVLHDMGEQIEQGKTAYVFPTVQAAQSYWKKHSGQSRMTACTERVMPRDKAHMLDLINSYLGY